MPHVKKKKNSYVDVGHNSKSYLGDNISYVGLIISYVGDNISYLRITNSYVGLTKSYVGLTHTYVGDNKSYVGDNLLRRASQVYGTETQDALRPNFEKSAPNDPQIT